MGGVRHQFRTPGPCDLEAEIHGPILVASNTNTGTAPKGFSEALRFLDQLEGRGQPRRRDGSLQHNLIVARVGVRSRPSVCFFAGSNSMGRYSRSSNRSPAVSPVRILQILKGGIKDFGEQRAWESLPGEEAGRGTGIGVTRTCSRSSFST